MGLLGLVRGGGGWWVKRLVTWDSSTAPEDVVERPGVVIEIAHEFHLFAFFGETRVVDQLGSLQHTNDKTKRIIQWDSFQILVSPSFFISSKVRRNSWINR